MYRYITWLSAAMVWVQFFEVFSVLAVLPFALSYWEDSRNGYLRCIETRIGRTAYCWSHLVVAFFGSVISIFLGMAVVYGDFGIEKYRGSKKRRA